MTDIMTDPTPRPWYATKSHKYIRTASALGDWNICEMNDHSEAFKEDARLIVRAANCHDALVDAAKWYRDQFELLVNEFHDGELPCTASDAKRFEEARAALAKVEEES